MALCKFDGWVGYDGMSVLLRAGDEWPDDHPMVSGLPDMFEVEQGPEDDAFPGPSVPGPSTPEVPEQEPEVPVRRKPGPKPGSSRTKPQT